MRIYKFELDIEDSTTLELPFGAEILTVQIQRGTPYLWAKVDEDETRTENVTIRMVGTGHVFDFDGTYISTFQVHGGDLVFHAFVVKS